MADRPTDAVDNEIASRVRNEWIAATRASFGSEAGLGVYVCECGFAGCTSEVELSREEYEAVRRDGIRFAVALNHEDPETERVVAEYGRYAVVEKWFGEARRVANDTDPRRPPLSPWGGQPSVSDIRDPEEGASGRRGRG